jgi:hypothetical protein
MGMSHEKSSVIAYNTEGSGIHHSNAGLQITHDMYINGYFMLLPQRVLYRIPITVSFASNVNLPIQYRNQSPVFSTWKRKTAYWVIIPEVSTDF